MTSPAKRTNWPAARAYYLALPADKRTFAAVARRFKVSDRRVQQVAQAEGWRDRADEVEARVERRAITVIVRNRAERLTRTLELFDRANDLALELLPIDEKGQIDVKALGDAKPRLDQLLSSMPGLFKMAELAAGEATDRVAISDVQPVLVAFARIAVIHAPADARGEVLRELEAASSGLLPIGEAAA